MQKLSAGGWQPRVASGGMKITALKGKPETGGLAGDLRNLALALAQALALALNNYFLATSARLSSTSLD